MLDSMMNKSIQIKKSNKYSIFENNYDVNKSIDKIPWWIRTYNIWFTSPILQPLSYDYTT